DSFIRVGLKFRRPIALELAVSRQTPAHQVSAREDSKNLRVSACEDLGKSEPGTWGRRGAGPHLAIAVACLQKKRLPPSLGKSPTVRRYRKPLTIDGGRVVRWVSACKTKTALRQEMGGTGFPGSQV